jgi:hypothetical protein
MSVYPLFLVLGSDGTVGAYAREDILQIHLAENKRLGEPARQVFKLNEHLMTVTYEPTAAYAEFLVPLENLCETCRAKALPESTVNLCPGCEQ